MMGRITLHNYEAYLLDKIERGVKQADAGQLISQEEARQRMAKWLK